MRIRSRRIDLAKDLRPGMKHRFTFYRDILIKSRRESSVDSIVRRDAIDCSHRGFKIKTELTEERRSVASYLCSLSFLLLNLGADVRFGGAPSPPQGFKSHSLSFFAAVPNSPNW